MEIAKVQVSGVQCKPVYLGQIPKGIMGATVSIEYTDPMWDGLRKTAVFRSTVTKDVLNVENEVTVPAEVVSSAGGRLYMGIYGVDAENNVVIPTIWTELGEIHGAAFPTGDSATDPTLPVWAQIQAVAHNAEALAQSVRDDADEGNFDGIPGPVGPQGAPATLVSQSVQYQSSDSGTIVPSGAWTDSVPVVAQGKYLWTRTTITYNTGDPVVSYSVSRFGIDGAGSVSTVCGKSPDSNGNVALAGADVGLGNVPNVSTNDQTPTYAEANTLAKLTSGETLSISFGKIAKAVTDLLSHIGSKSNPHDVTAAQVNGLLDKTYPVGAIYLSTVATSPAALFGGTWERLKDRFLLGAGDDYAAGETGGAAEVALTIPEMPSHYHGNNETNKNGTIGLADSGGTEECFAVTWGAISPRTDINIRVGAAGEGQPHNNMPPYLAVYMWKRIA